jgi:hypothetical protein
MQITRRRLLLGGAAAGVAAAAYATLRQVGRYPDAEPGYKLLDPKQVAIFQVLGDYLLPPGGPLPGSGGDRDTLTRLDSYVGGMPPDRAWVVMGLALVFEHGTAFDRYGARRLTQLPAERRAQYLKAWSKSSVVVQQQLWMAARSILGVVYFDRADVLAAMKMNIACQDTP